MKDLLCDEFQNTVSELLIRHQSILDVLSKLQEASARINRAVTKAVTSCGCIKVNAEKRSVPNNISISELKGYIDSHLNGQLCPNCQEIVEAEIGRDLFYLAALCNHLDLNLYDIFIKEHKKLSTLRFFNFT
ncbi:MAG: nucleoside triphosphate pyrophosphohydrolase family protein [Eubacteriales bacterium]